MSLSKKLSALDETKKKTIEVQLQEKFPNSVAVQVLLLPRVQEWMDSRPWENSNVAAHSMSTITNMLQDKISGTEDEQGKSVFQYLLSSIQNTYSDHDKPNALLKHLFEIYNFIQNQVNEMVDSEECMTSLTQQEGPSHTEDQSFDFHKNLESVETLVKENDNHIREIQQLLKEREKLFFSQNNLEIENLKITNNNSVTIQDKSNKISEIAKRMNENKNDIEKQNQSIVASLKPLFGNIFDLVFTRNKDLQSHIFSQISEWNHNKLQAQVGWPVYSFSDFLQPLMPVCNRFAKILLSTHSQAQKLADILSKIGADTESLKHGENLRNTSRSMLCAFLKSCFVVDKQPPPTQLIDKVFRVSLRLLLGSDVLSPSATPTVTCSLHLDDDIRRFQRTNFESVKAQDVNAKKTVTNNEKALTYDKQTDSFCVSFDKLKLPRKLEKRKTKLDGDKAKLVTDQKSCLMFQTQITIDNESFTTEAFSVPIVVMTNTSQCLESEATIFWDNAFGSKDREPFISPDRVSLKDFLEALNKRWAKSNERELEEHHLYFLAKKLIPDTDIKSEELHKYHVTKLMFNKEHMKVGTYIFPFTFWSWFYKAMKLVKEFLFDEWRDGKIYGFIDKSEAEFKLSEHLVGTFLLRFSDSVPGGISIAYKENMEGCNHVRPWTKEELKQKSFSNSMNDLQNHSELRCLQYLYPTATPINEAFPQKEESSIEEFNPRYPKNAILRVVRHDDNGSASASNFSSNQSVSFHNTSPPPSAERMSESTNGNEQAFSPFSLSLDDDPMFGQANQYYPSDFMGGNMMDGENEDFF